VSIVDVQAPHDLKIGYIMGAGDDIPTVLKQVGMNVTMIPAETAGERKAKPIRNDRAGHSSLRYAERCGANNQKLLDFVSAGGTLVVQYNTGVGDFNSGHFTPYPAELSRARVSVEEAPVEILAPEDGIFHYPNTITARDFDGWVQERGLYFMDKWDEHFKPLLAATIRVKTRRRAGCCRRTMARERISTRDMLSSGSCRRECRERCGFM
jgi:hypothetical protein